MGGLCPSKTTDPVGRGVALVLKERRKGYQGIVDSQDHTSSSPTSSYIKTPGKESACNAGDLGSILGSERSPGEGNNYPLQCSHLGNPVDRGAWQATVHGVTKSRT